MKKTNTIWPMLMLAMVFALSCSTDGDNDHNIIYPVPPDAMLAEITTAPITAITETSATGGGTIATDNDTPVTARGICWGTAELPTTAGTKTTDGAGIGTFTSSITGLTAGTVYYVRAYAINAAGTAYGNQVAFTASDAITEPIVTTTAVTGISATAAASGGNVMSDGGAAVTARGVAYGTTTDPTVAGTHTTNGAGTGTFTASITGLLASTTYYARAYATNSVGTSYGEEFSFTTTAAATIAIGQTHEGGIVFYVDGTGQHGLVAAPTNQGTFKWGCEGTSVPGTSTAVGSGMANTNAIVMSCTEANTAAKICYNLVLNGKDDWYLPSKGELALLHQNLHQQGLGGFTMDRYWSSSQYDNNNAWCQFFNANVNVLWYDKDLIPYSVRAIRSF